MEVADGRVVTLDYTVRMASGRPVDSTGECGPVSVLCGAGQLLPALEERLAGMRAGDTRQFVIPAEEAYGAWHPELVRSVPRERLPPNLELAVGGEYRLRAPGGRTLCFRVLEITADQIRADFNLRAAGEALAATVTVLAVRAPTTEEERRGRT